MYQALYRKWRPRTFDDVVGQSHVTETLKNQVASGRLSHAYLFVGTRGTGKTTCAKILAKAVNCEHPVNGNPCNKCKSCIGIDEGSIMDVVELDAASNNGVDNIRALRDEAVFSPASVKKRVYIIDEVHMLSASAFNALLKILEEPPEHLMFILATTELHKVLPTVLSRCQRHSFKRIGPEDMAKRIAYVAGEEGFDLEPDAATLLARLADGSLRDGMSLLDQCSGPEHITAESVLESIGLSGNMRIGNMLRLVAAGDTKAALEDFNSLYRDGKAPATVLSEMSALLRDILMTKVAPKGGAELLSGGYEPKLLKEFAAQMTAEEIMCNIDSIQSRIGSLRDGRDPKTAAELCIVGMCQPDLGDSLEHLKARVARLEEGGIPARAMMSPEREAPVQKSREVKKETPPKRQERAVKETRREEPPFEMAPPPVDDRAPFDDIAPPPIEEEPPFDMAPPPVDDRAPFDMAPPPVEEEPPFEMTPPPVREEPRFERAPETSQAVEETGDTWSEIKAELKKVLPVFSMVHFKDAKGVISGDKLTIYVKSAFNKKQLETANMQESIREAAAKVIGHQLPIRISEEKEPPKAMGNLDELSKFSNVTFE